MDKENILRADQKVSRNTVLVADRRKFDVRNVLCHPFGPLSWPLANDDSTIEKNNIAIVAKHLESKVSPAEDAPHPCASLIDALDSFRILTLRLVHSVSSLTTFLHRCFLLAKKVIELIWYAYQDSPSSPRDL